MDATLPGEGRAVIGASFELLEHLRRLGRARLVELVRASGLPRATVHRMLVQLSAVGAVRRDGDHYRLGATLLALGGSVSPAHRLREAAARPLAELAIFTGGAVSLSERIDRDAVLLDAIPGRRALPGAIRAEPGATLPLGTATARVHGVGNTSTSAAPTLALDDRSVSADLSCVAARVSAASPAGPWRRRSWPGRRWPRTRPPGADQRNPPVIAYCPVVRRSESEPGQAESGEAGWSAKSSPGSCSAPRAGSSPRRWPTTGSART